MNPRFTGPILCLLLTLPLWAYDREVWTSYPNMNHVTALAEGDVQIYVATTGGIRRYDRFVNRWLPPLTTLDGLPDNRVQRLAYDPDTGDLWFDTPSGSGSGCPGWKPCPWPPATLSPSTTHPGQSPP